DGNVLNAEGSPTTARGGGLAADVGVGSIAGSLFEGNRLTASSSGGDATVEGGGLDSGLSTRITVRSSRFRGSRLTASGGNSAGGVGGGIRDDGPGPLSLSKSTVDRSEERRVGKECRSRWAPA